MPDRSVSSELNIPTTIYETLRPHQIEALEFLWEKLVTKGICTTDYLNNAAKLASTEVFGAILGHSMGLGKTLTTLTFLILVQDYVRRCSSSRADGPSDVCPNLRVLVVAPRSIVEHWQESAVDWLTPAFLGDSSPPPLFVPALSPDTQSILINFYMQGGLLALGYEEYVRLVQSAREQPTILDCKPVRSMLAECGFKKDYMYSNYTLRNIAGKDFTDKVCTIEILEDADIVVLDEAHRLRRATSKSVQNLSYHLRRVPIRLALTGTPLQNHLQDYNVMLSVVTGSTVNARQFSTLFVKPIQKGQSVDASYHQFLEMQKCVASMRQYFGKFVHYCGPKVLEEYLPPRMEYVFFVELSPEQEARYKKILEEVPRTTKDGLALVIHHNLSHVCLHPYLCRSDASSYTQVGGGGSPRLPNDGLDDDPTAFDAPDVEVENTITSIEDIALSPKLHFALQLTQHITKVRGEKVVIFSHYISHLVLVKELLCQFYQIDSAIFSGSLSPSDRGALIRRFKESGSLKVLLCSVRAGGVGIDLCAANHCILLDVSWNPTDDAQATYRIYRFGQKKTVYVYRLACTGTTEHVVFSYSLQKTWLHRKIEDVMDPTRHQQHMVKNYFIYPARIPIPGAKDIADRSARRISILHECNLACPPVAELMENEQEFASRISHLVEHSFLLVDNEEEVVREIGERFQMQRRRSTLLSSSMKVNEPPAAYVVHLPSRSGTATSDRRPESRLEKAVIAAVDHLVSFLSNDIDDAPTAISKMFLLASPEAYEEQLEKCFLKAFQDHMKVLYESKINTPAYSYIKSLLSTKLSRPLLSVLQTSPFDLLDYYEPYEETYIATELGCVRPLVIHTLVEGVKSLFTGERYRGHQAELDMLNNCFENDQEEVTSLDEKLKQARENIERCYDLMWPQYEDFTLPTIPFRVDEELEATKQCFLDSGRRNGVFSIHDVSEVLGIKLYENEEALSAMCKRCSSSELKRVSDSAFSCPRCFYNLESEIRLNTQLLHRATLYQLSTVHRKLALLDVERTFSSPPKWADSVYDLLFSCRQLHNKDVFPLVENLFENGVSTLLSEFPEHTVNTLAVQSGAGLDMELVSRLLVANAHEVWVSLLRNCLKKDITDAYRQRVASRSLATLSGMPMMQIILALCSLLSHENVEVVSELLHSESAALIPLRSLTDCLVNYLYLEKLLVHIKAHPAREDSTSSTPSSYSDDEEEPDSGTADPTRVPVKRPRSLSSDEVSSFHLQSADSRSVPASPLSTASFSSFGELSSEEVERGPPAEPKDTAREMRGQRVVLYWTSFGEVYGTDAVLSSPAAREQLSACGLGLEKLGSHNCSPKSVLECVELFIRNATALSQKVRLIIPQPGKQFY